jgi:hypothetical protein
MDIFGIKSLTFELASDPASLGYMPGVLHAHYIHLIPKIVKKAITPLIECIFALPPVIHFNDHVSKKGLVHDLRFVAFTVSVPLPRMK